MEGKSSRDETVHKFSTNFRKYLENHKVTSEKSNAARPVVKFNRQTIETSIGGTQRAGEINVDSTIDESSLSFMANSSTDTTMSTSCGEDSVIYNPNFKPNSRADTTTKTLHMPSTRNTTRKLSGKTSLLNRALSEDERRRSESAVRSGDAGVFDKLPVPVKDLGRTTPTRRHTLDQSRLLKTPECFNTVSFETPLAKGKHRRSSADLYGNGDDDSTSVTVAVRVRPYSQRYVYLTVFIELTNKGIILLSRER